MIRTYKFEGTEKFPEVRVKRAGDYIEVLAIGSIGGPPDLYFWTFTDKCKSNNRKYIYDRLRRHIGLTASCTGFYFTMQDVYNKINERGITEFGEFKEDSE